MQISHNTCHTVSVGRLRLLVEDGSREQHLGRLSVGGGCAGCWPWLGPAACQRQRWPPHHCLSATEKRAQVQGYDSSAGKGNWLLIFHDNNRGLTSCQPMMISLSSAYKLASLVLSWGKPSVNKAHSPCLFWKQLVLSLGSPHCLFYLYFYEPCEWIDIYAYRCVCVCVCVCEYMCQSPHIFRFVSLRTVGLFVFVELDE